jgi:hypothetical protein
MLWGRVTYEMMESYWPAVAGGDEEAPPAIREWAVKLAAELDRLDLIDAYKLLVHPRIAGHGPTLYQSGLRHPKEEAQRRDRAVDGRRAGAGFMLVNLKPAQILLARGVGRTAKEGGKTPDMLDIVLLGMWPQAAHHHVVLHALAQRADRSVSRIGSHGKFLSLKELHGQPGPHRAHSL